MITGRVNSNLEAIIRIGVQDSRDDYHTFDCVIDTGFDGFIALPDDIIQELGLVRRGNRRIILVNDTEASMPVYLGMVAWHGEPVEVSVLGTEQEFLVGAALLENNTLTVQVWNGGDVLIEQR